MILASPVWQPFNVWHSAFKKGPAALWIAPSTEKLHQLDRIHRNCMTFKMKKTLIEITSATTKQRTVRCIDNCINLQPGDITSPQANHIIECWWNRWRHITTFNNTSIALHWNKGNDYEIWINMWAGLGQLSIVDREQPLNGPFRIYWKLQTWNSKFKKNKIWINPKNCLKVQYYHISSSIKLLASVQVLDNTWSNTILFINFLRLNILRTNLWTYKAWFFLTSNNYQETSKVAINWHLKYVLFRKTLNHFPS